MTIINTIFGPLQISRVPFGDKGLTFKKPPSWALTGKPVSESQKKQWIHLAESAVAGTGIKGTIVYKGKKGAKRIPAIAAFVGFLRLGLKEKAAIIKMHVSKNKGNKYDPVAMTWDVAKKNAMELVNTVPDPPKAPSKKEQEMLRKGITLSSFFEDYKKELGEAKGEDKTGKKRGNKRSWYDDSQSLDFDEVGSFF